MHYCTLKYWWGQKLTSSSSLSPSLSSASDDAILFPLNAADDADSGKFDFYCVFHFIRPRKPPVHNQKFGKMLRNQDHTLLLILTRPME